MINYRKSKNVCKVALICKRLKIELMGLNFIQHSK